MVKEQRSTRSRERKEKNLWRVDESRERRSGEARNR